MGDEIKKPGRNPYEEYGASVARMTFPGLLLTFNRFGDYKAGRDKDDVPPGTRMIVLVPTTLIGHVKWWDNKPVDYKVGLLSEGFVPTKKEDLPDRDKSTWETFDDGEPKDPWQFSNMVVMINVKTHEVYTFTTSSKSGLGALGTVIKAYGNRIRQHPDEYPEIELQRSSYDNRKYGEVRIPVLKIVNWVSNEEPDATLAAATGGGDDSGMSGGAAAKPTRKPAKVKAIAARTAVKPATKTAAAKPAAKTTTQRWAKGPVRI